MNAEKDIRRSNAWLSRRIRPNHTPDHTPKDAHPITDYEFQVPSHWLDNLALWAKVMLVVITLAFLAGYASVFLWVFDNVGHFK